MRYERRIFTVLLLFQQSLILSFQLNFPILKRTKGAYKKVTFELKLINENFYDYHDGPDGDGDGDGDGGGDGGGDGDGDDYIDADKLVDWREFRMNLARTVTSSGKNNWSSQKKKSISKENEVLLRIQSESLAEECMAGVWAHEVSHPEVGGLVIRMPLEVEVYRSKKIPSAGEELRNFIKKGEKVELWYRKAHTLCEKEIQKITAYAENGQIDASKISEVSNEFLQMYLDNQETWQEVCLVVDRNNSGGTASALVLNRPMAYKLTENLGLLILEGVLNDEKSPRSCVSVDMLMEAFGEECAVYVGGPDAQGESATLLHGFKDLPGAVEIAPGCNIFIGGIDHAIKGVKDGKYKPLDFRFFIGKHEFKNRQLDKQCILGKYQPIACSRPVVLKQCISLPTPLYYEVMELCGGELERISLLEQKKRN